MSTGDFIGIYIHSYFYIGNLNICWSFNTFKQHLLSIATYKTFEYTS